jgi:O-antigen ligase
MTNLFNPAVLLNPSTYIVLVAFLIPFGELQLRLGLVKVVILLLVLAALSNKVIKNEPIYRTPLDVPILLFAGAVLPSLIYSDDTRQVAVFFLSIVGYYLLNLVIYNCVKNEETIMRIIKAYLASMLIVSVLGIFQFATGQTIVNVSDKTELYYVGRSLVILGTASNPNAFAAHFILAIPLATSILLFSKKIRVKVLSAVLIVFYSTVLFVTLSRGAMLGVLFGVGLLFFYFIKGGMVRLRTVLILIVCVILSMSFLWRLYPEYSLAIYFDSDSEFVLEDKVESSNVRKDLIKANLLLFLDHPFLGVGYDKSRNYMEAHGLPYRLSPHSIFIGIASELGLLGLVPFLCILIITINKTLKGLKYARGTMMYGVLAGLFGAFAAYQINGLVHMSIAAASYWLVLSMLLAGSKISDREVLPRV